MIITIDGPAGAGKSTVAKRVAKNLGYRFLDTGAMYRAVTWAAMQQGIDVKNHSAVAAVAAKTEITFDSDRVFVDSQEVTTEIRSQAVTNNVSEIADNAEVREQMVMLQREITAEGDFVCEGRDQGTVVFPNAECKIYLTASAKERAQRRCDQMSGSEDAAEFATILKEQQDRDQRDLDRPVGRLLKARDAIEIISDKRSIDQVVDEIVDIARNRQACLSRDSIGNDDG